MTKIDDSGCRSYWHPDVDEVRRALGHGHPFQVYYVYRGKVWCYYKGLVPCCHSKLFRSEQELLAAGYIESPGEGYDQDQ